MEIDLHGSEACLSPPRHTKIQLQHHQGNQHGHNFPENCPEREGGKTPLTTRRPSLSRHVAYEGNVAQRWVISTPRQKHKPTVQRRQTDTQTEEYTQNYKRRQVCVSRKEVEGWQERLTFALSKNNTFVPSKMQYCRCQGEKSSAVQVRGTAPSPTMEHSGSWGASHGWERRQSGVGKQSTVAHLGHFASHT